MLTPGEPKLKLNWASAGVAASSESDRSKGTKRMVSSMGRTPILHAVAGGPDLDWKNEAFLDAARVPPRRLLHARQRGLRAGRGFFRDVVRGQSGAGPVPAGCGHGDRR